jgi:3D (Asp-Asp-Asp) domain-containing protein
MKPTSTHMQKLIFFFTLLLGYTNLQANLCDNISIHDAIDCSKLEVIESKIDELNYDCDTVITAAQIAAGYTISTSGVYCVGASGTNSNAGNAITIAADNVVLNLGNHTITVANLAGVGVGFSGARKNITIKNGTIVSEFKGITTSGATSVTQLTVSDMVLERTGTVNSTAGIELTSPTVAINILIERCQANGFRANFRVSATNCIINSCIARDAADGGGNPYGFEVISNAIGTVLNDCIAENNGSNGMALDGSCELNNCIAIKNGSYGICLGNGVTNLIFTLNNCIAQNNTASGFRIDGTSTLKCCVAQKNGLHGFEWLTSGRGSGSILHNCLATQNTGGSGFHINSSNNNQLIQCKANNNSSVAGFRILGTSSSNIFLQCVATGNTSSGFRIQDTATKNIFSECQAVGNTSIGFYTLSTGASLNKFVSNISSGNPTGFRRDGAAGVNDDLFTGNCSYGDTTAYTAASNPITVNGTITTAQFWENV